METTRLFILYSLSLIVRVYTVVLELRANNGMNLWMQNYSQGLIDPHPRCQSGSPVSQAPKLSASGCAIPLLLFFLFIRCGAVAGFVALASRRLIFVAVVIKLHLISSRDELHVLIAKESLLAHVTVSLLWLLIIY